jgi:hypothetical protein
MPQINYWAVLAAGVSSMVLGALWYSPVMFLKPWMRALGITQEKGKATNMGRIMTSAFVLALIGAFVFGMFLGPKPTLALGLGAGFSAGLCWVAGSYGINYLFEQKPLSLFLINGGYHTVQYTLFGLLFALLP